MIEKLLIFKEIFHSSNILICLSNIAVFVTFLILFFWFVLSKQFDAIILEKVKLISLVAKYDPKFKTVLKNYLYSNDSITLAAKATQQENLRYENNVNALQIEVMPFVYILSTLWTLNLIYMIWYKRKLLFSEWILLLLVLGAFITEVIFYFILVNEWKFIGDFELVYKVVWS